MAYRDERKNAILQYYKNKGIAFLTDGKHPHVIRKEDTDINIVESVKHLGYKTAFNDKGTIVGIDNGAHFFRLDWRSNNVTSSSMLSACFFALLINNQDKFIDFLKRFFNKCFHRDLDIYAPIFVELEWFDRDGDKSHIDALISFNSNGEKYRIFTEIKYCEEAYGTRKRYDNSKTPEEEKTVLQEKYINSTKYWHKYHSERLKLDGYLNGCKTIEEYESSKYSKYYQIIRNVSHASLKTNDYCLFLLAKGNEEAAKDITNGLDELKIQNEELIDSRVGILFFEDVLDTDSDIFKKYFSLN